MATVTIDIPEDIFEKVRADAQATRHSVEEYVLGLLEERAERLAGPETWKTLLSGIRQRRRELGEKYGPYETTNAIRAMRDERARNRVPD